MEIVVKAESELSETERQQIDAICRQAFGDNATPYIWVLRSDWHVLVNVDDLCVSQVGIVERVARVAGQPVKLGGVGGVATSPQWQRRGLAGTAMGRAAELMRDQLAVDFGLLVCGRDRVPMYNRLGWQAVPGPLIIDQPQGKVTFADVTMVLPCVETVWRPGIIDLCGLPW
jgi:hypothetical protein